MNLLIPLVLTALICLTAGFAIGYLTGAGRAESVDHPIGDHTQPAAAPASPAKPLPPAIRRAELYPAQEPPLSVSPVRPSLNPVDMLARALKPDLPRPADPTSITVQIDEILQEKLAQRLPGEARKVRLVDLPGGGAVIRIGPEQYDGVDAVPEPAIRALIHEAVQEWERRAQG